MSKDLNLKYFLLGGPEDELFLSNSSDTQIMLYFYTLLYDRVFARIPELLHISLAQCYSVLTELMSFTIDSKRKTLQPNPTIGSYKPPKESPTKQQWQKLNSHPGNSQQGTTLIPLPAPILEGRRKEIREISGWFFPEISNTTKRY